MESVFKKGPDILNHCDISDPYLIKENRKNMHILEEDNLNILGQIEPSPAKFVNKIRNQFEKSRTNHNQRNQHSLNLHSHPFSNENTPKQSEYD